MLDQRAFGGQAGASARIENYLGFPTGISGLALAGRAFNQAQKFGAEIAIPLEVARLDCGGGELAAGDPPRLELVDGRSVRARTVVIASGARYRRPDISNLSTFEGAGDLVLGLPDRSQAVRGRRGGADRRRQLGGPGGRVPRAQGEAPAPDRARAPGWRRRCRATWSTASVRSPMWSLHVGKEIIALEGDQAHGLTAAVPRHRPSGAIHACALRHLFLFIGADPNTGWLQNCVAVDRKGFVITGNGFAHDVGPNRRAALPLETTLPGVFAIGDVRAGSTKRVAAAVGEGAAVVAQIHTVLRAGAARLTRPRTLRRMAARA